MNNEENIKRSSFLLYLDKKEIVDNLTNEQAGKLLKAIYQYVDTKEEIELDPVTKIVFVMFKVMLDKDEINYHSIVERNRINGVKGGRPRKNPKNPLGNLETQKTQSNPKNPNNNNNNNNNNDNKLNIYSPDELEQCDSIPYKEICEHLNLRTNSNYRYTTKKTKDLIKARFNEGFTLDDFKEVIDKKTVEWINDKDMNKFLRPETLFGTKFESYLNQKVQKKELTTNDIAKTDDFKEFLKRRMNR